MQEEALSAENFDEKLTKVLHDVDSNYSRYLLRMQQQDLLGPI